jgi:hypothetical protein
MPDGYGGMSKNAYVPQGSRVLGYSPSAPMSDIADLDGLPKKAYPEPPE